MKRLHPRSVHASSPATRGDRSIAVAWGFAEATAFFIVPDVWLTVLARRSPRAAWTGLVGCLAGALAGGALMWTWGTADATGARGLLDAVPAIAPDLIARVDGQIDRVGLASLFVGAFSGLPYKIYAVEWGARDGNLVALLLTTIPARATRFALSIVAARWVLDRLARWTQRRGGVELGVIALFWVAFYGAYFTTFRG